MKRSFHEVLGLFLVGGVTGLIIASVFTNDPQTGALAFVAGGAGFDMLIKYMKNKESS